MIPHRDDWDYFRLFVTDMDDPGALAPLLKMKVGLEFLEHDLIETEIVSADTIDGDDIEELIAEIKKADPDCRVRVTFYGEVAGHDTDPDDDQGDDDDDQPRPRLAIHEEEP